METKAMLVPYYGPSIGIHLGISTGDLAESNLMPKMKTVHASSVLASPPPWMASGENAADSPSKAVLGHA